MLVQPRTKIFTHLSFAKKIGGMAAFLMCLFGGLSVYSLMDSYEIRREIEETTQSDIPLLHIAIRAQQKNVAFGNIVKDLEYRQQHPHLNDVHGVELGRAIHQLHSLSGEINELAARGVQQAENSVREEYLKEGKIRLNQVNEDYQEISRLFNEFSSSHEIVHLSLYHLKGNAYHSHQQGQRLEDLLQEIAVEVDNAEQVAQEIFERLDVHMQSSLEIAMQEQSKLQVFSLSLAIMAIASGSLLTISLIYQLQNSLRPVTQKAKKIAKALGEENYDVGNEGLNEAEIAQTITAGKDIAELGLAFNQMVANFTKSRESQRHIENLLAKEKSFMGFTLGSINDGVITLDGEGRILTVNMAAKQLLNCDVEQFVRQNFELFLVDKFSVHWELMHGDTATQQKRVTLEHQYGQAKVLDMSHGPIQSESGEILGSVIVIHDITQMVRANEQLAWRASHDSLTGLANRHSFLACLEGLAHSDKGSDIVHSLLYLDLDRFKIVNDTCGHGAGDELLIQLSHCLNQEIRQTDLVARLGGDEFGIILKHCPLERAIAIANNILAALNEFRFMWEDRHFSVEVSIGAVAYFPHSDNPIMILNAADQACYHAKHQGRNQVFAVMDTQRQLAHKSVEMHWLRTINQALEENNFQLYQQRIIAVQGNDTADHEHFEILLRLKTSDGKILVPSVFLPIAEQYGLMAKIDRWVISHFFASQGNYLRSFGQQSLQGKHSSFYSVNLSSDSLNDPELIPFLEEQFTSHQIPPSLICFEITETMAIANIDRAAQIIQQIKSLGCRFALDDFGSGMSSFGYLQQLPVDFLKIDGQFIQQLCQNSMNEIIVTALRDVAQAVNIKTIAEFVDNEKTLKKLQEIGIDYAQGYYVGRPNPVPRMQLLKQPVSSQYLPVLHTSKSY